MGILHGNDSPCKFESFSRLWAFRPWEKKKLVALNLCERGGGGGRRVAVFGPAGVGFRLKKIDPPKVSVSCPRRTLGVSFPQAAWGLHRGRGSIDGEKGRIGNEGAAKARREDFLNRGAGQTYVFQFPEPLVSGPPKTFQRLGGNPPLLHFFEDKNTGFSGRFVGRWVTKRASSGRAGKPNVGGHHFRPGSPGQKKNLFSGLVRHVFRSSFGGAFFWRNFLGRKKAFLGG